MEFCLKTRKSLFPEKVSGILVVGLLSVGVAECRTARTIKSMEYPAINCRKHSAILTEFGGTGDGKTSNTKAFKSAIDHLSQFVDDGGAQLIVPPGKWLTGSFNLTSHFTLYIHEDAIVLGSQDESDYPHVTRLPSYGGSAGRFSSLIFGTNLTDVVVAGGNGTINGQGKPWWDKFRKKKLKDTRPNLIEIMFSDQVQISNLTLINSPSWNVHPIYSRNVIIQGLTIMAPVTVPNTDGINPDSCTNIRIEDCYIVSGDDCIAVKSGMNKDGVEVGMPTEGLIIRRLTCVSSHSAVIALGSEMSGGIRNVRAEDITAMDSESGLRIKTGLERGGYVKDIYVRRMTMKTMKFVFWITGNYGSPPAPGQEAFPAIEGINYKDMVAENVTYPAQLHGISGDPFTGICISNVTIGLSKKTKKQQWDCKDVEGVTSRVTPKPCDLLPPSNGISNCDFPEGRISIEDVKLKTCSVKFI